MCTNHEGNNVTAASSAQFQATTKTKTTSGGKANQSKDECHHHRSITNDGGSRPNAAKSLLPPCVVGNDGFHSTDESALDIETIEMFELAASKTAATVSAAVGYANDRKFNTLGAVRRTSDIEDDGRRHCDRKRCFDCCRRFVAFFFTTVGSCCLMIGYVIVGGLVFCGLEAEHERVTRSDMRRIRRRHIEWLWNLTYRMNVLHPANWTHEADVIFSSFTQEVDCKSFVRV
jgi:hypothetical protein